jgi:hypothetical protein
MARKPVDAGQHLTFVIANSKSSGRALKAFFTRIGDSELSQLDLTPLVLTLLKSESLSSEPLGATPLRQAPINEAL